MAYLVEDNKKIFECEIGISLDEYGHIMVRDSVTNHFYIVSVSEAIHLANRFALFVNEIQDLPRED